MSEIRAKSPYIFIVRGKKEGSRVTVNYDTKRIVNRGDVIRSDTLRHLHREDAIRYDTARLIRNMNNILFDTRRKIDRDETSINDTIRIIKSKLPINNVSVYVHSNRAKPVECVIFQNTGFFPYKDKYVKVQLDHNGKFGYLPLAHVGDEYDSGLRYTEDDGTTWQICTNVIYNLIDHYFKADNLFINASDLNYVYMAFRKLFSSRVTLGNNCIYVMTPPVDCGITKMFMLGLDLRISWCLNNTDDFSKAITLSTYYDGLNDTSFGGDNKRKANAMLVKFEPRKLYKIEFFNKRGKISYNDIDQIKGVFILGRDVERMFEYSASYKLLVDTKSYCTCNELNYEMEDASNMNSKYYDYMIEMKDKWMKYKNSNMVYNYYELKNIQTKK